MPDGSFRPDPDRTDEYLLSLQAQLDQALDRGRRLERRVEKLETDKARLRSQLEDARSRGRLLRKKPSEPASDERATAAPSEQSGSRTPQVGPIPDEPLPDFAPRLDIKVATILDPFSRAAFGYEFRCVDLDPADWLEQLDREDPALLLVESVFSGATGRWAARVARFGSTSAALGHIVDWFHQRGRPTVFWNKEDPINYDWFIASASLFRHVFTVDGDAIPRYRRDCDHDRVGLLQFGAQPAIHHPPADEAVRTGSVAFAGSYYAQKHPERRRQMEYLIGASLDFGLDIFDRSPGSDERFAWPERYRAHVIGSLTYPQTLEAYRRYRVFLNVNTVTHSPTMFARRVFELLASNTVVVSGPSLAIKSLMPPGIIALVHDEVTTHRAVSEILADHDEWQRRSTAGFEWIVAERHTMTARVEQILTAVL